MPSEAKHHIGGGIGLASLLAAAAGFVDAFVFLRVVPVFVANMSGNLIRLGIASGQGRASAAIGSGVALLAFMSGVATAAVHVDRRLVRDLAPLGRRIFMTETALYLVAAAYLLLLDVHFESAIAWTNLPIILLGAFAMGMQAVGLRRVGEIPVSTTYGTGAIVRLSEKAALAFRRAPRPGDAPRRSTMAVLSVVLLAYVAGAAAASAAGRSPAWLLLPAAFQLVAAIEAGR